MAGIDIYTLSLHDALPILACSIVGELRILEMPAGKTVRNFAHNEIHKQLVSHARSEEHTSELQSQSNLVCRLLLEKKNVVRHRFIGPTEPIRPHYPSCGVS